MGSESGVSYPSPIRNTRTTHPTESCNSLLDSCFGFHVAHFSFTYCLMTFCGISCLSLGGSIYFCFPVCCCSGLWLSQLLDKCIASDKSKLCLWLRQIQIAHKKAEKLSDILTRWAKGFWVKLKPKEGQNLFSITVSDCKCLLQTQPKFKM